MFGVHKNRYLEEKSPKLTHLLISVMTAIFLLEVYLGYAYGQKTVSLLFQNYGFSLAGFVSGNWWTPLTSIFLHASPEHLLLNMFALYFFGRVVEQQIGWKKMLLIFMGTGIAGDAALSAAALLGLSSPLIPTIGASAAIFGLLGVAMFLKPMEIVMYPYIVPVPLILVALLYVLYNITAFAAILASGQESEIAYVAHIGGLAAGILAGLKIEGKKRGALILLAFILLIIVILAAWKYVSLIEGANYLSIFASAVK
ncbi:rhomboid family intramembrane serine protease [archaeon]|nr:MAG: rhomboid family intramembrane serine protease [archaeon]